MRYTFGQAEAFYWVARLGGFRAAADHLCVSQPTVSIRIKELERIFGDKLFDRSAYRPVLTRLGRALYSDVERLLHHATSIERRITHSDTGLLRIGAADSFAATVLPDLLVSLASRYQSLQVDVTVDFSTRLEQLLLDKAIDIAFLSQPRGIEGLTIVPLWEIDLVWVIGRKLSFDGDQATPEKLVDLPIFTNSPPSGLFTTIQMWFGQRGLRPHRLNTCNPLTVIARLANAGTGAALLPREMIRLSGEDLDLRILRAEPSVPGHTLCAVWWETNASDTWPFLADMARQISTGFRQPADPA